MTSRHSLSNRAIRVLLRGTLLGYCALILPASASVIVQATRIIYPADAREVSLQLSNSDAHPNLIQVWADINNPQSDPENADAPFIVTPPIFRMEAKSGQTVRIMLTADHLPQDRESVFYLNTLQIPPKAPEYSDQNRIQLTLRNRLKLFYRPNQITGKPSDIESQLSFHIAQQGQDWLITAHNPTGYFATLTAGQVLAEKRAVPFKTEMLAPFSQAEWRLINAGTLPSGPLRISAALVNDFGGQVLREYGIAR